MAAHSILIVDDEANQRLMLMQALRAVDQDWTIATAATAQEALALIAHSPPDLIITDYHMPVMNGIELISRLRTCGVASRIFLITAYSSPDLVDAAQQLLVDQCLTKPVPLRLLRRLTTDALDEVATDGPQTSVCPELISSPPLP